MKTVGVIIGRFQLPRLHDGHLALINHVLAESDEVCILVGVATTPSLKNLLPYPAVVQMIRRAFLPIYSSGRLQIHPLWDTPEQDLAWSLNIDKFLSALYPDYKIQLWSGRDSYKPHYHGKFRPVKDWYGYNGEVNGSKIRDAIIEGNPIDSPDFRAGIIYGLGNYLRARNRHIFLTTSQAAQLFWALNDKQDLISYEVRQILWAGNEDENVSS